ncbi:MAG: hypothetical protein PCFJNLEI_03655 [Verrucomicrobiae bacterium]|nr:hypothetical protein [Verrucomicrobiae bacterium]
MEAKPKPNVEELLKAVSLSLEYTTELPDKVGAILDNHPKPAYIAVNQKRPICEQHFWIWYELGRFIYAGRPARKLTWAERLINRKYHSHFMKVWSRYNRLYIHRHCGPELRNELFAITLMIQLGQKDDLRQYLEKHPKMAAWVIYCIVALRFLHMRRQFQAAIRQLFGVNGTIA